MNLRFKYLIIFFVVVFSLFSAFWYFSINSSKSRASTNSQVIIGREKPKTKVKEWPFDSTLEAGETAWTGGMLSEGSPIILNLTVSDGYLNVYSEKEALDYSSRLANIYADVNYSNSDVIVEVEMKADFKKYDPSTKLLVGGITSNSTQLSLYTGKGKTFTTNSSQTFEQDGNAVYTFTFNKSKVGTSGIIKNVIFYPTLNADYYLLNLRINRVTFFSRK